MESRNLGGPHECECNLRDDASQGKVGETDAAGVFGPMSTLHPASHHNHKDFKPRQDNIVCFLPYFFTTYLNLIGFINLR